jgi:transcription initiation factor TFIIIB Brf1 subunit/transcription initiation factor TFIIB
MSKIVEGNFDYIWNEIDKINNENTLNKQAKYDESITFCKICESTNLKIDNNIICGDCGLILSEYRISDNAVFNGSENIDCKFKSTSIKSKRLSKMQEWYTWTNEEKNTYKLKEYIKVLCARLDIVESIIYDIIYKSIIVMNTVKKYDGTKRARVKDGIIITCIHHISKSTLTPYCYIELANKIDLDIKYVTKAEKFISELINMKRLEFKEFQEMKKKNPYDYIISTMKRNNIKVSNDILKKAKILIELCEDNDILQDHTPLSIGCCCFYYILKSENIDIDLKTFSNIYNISIVTIVKTYNKLLLYKNNIDKWLN